MKRVWNESDACGTDRALTLQELAKETELCRAFGTRMERLKIDEGTLCFFDATVSTIEDIRALEKAVARVLHGEDGRCGYLRSAAYTKLKLDALYSTRGEDHCVRVSLVRLTMDASKRVRGFVDCD